MPVSSVPIGCCTDYTVAGKCTVDGNNNKEDKTREEADMTPSPVFPKSSKVAQNFSMYRVSPKKVYNKQK